MNNDNRYLAFLFSSPTWRSQIRSQVYGVKVYSITQQILNSTKVLLPPVEEQEAIAAYLDSRCADIDKVIATQEKRIDLLKELKQSAITEAVTKGLNPNAEMKDSGIEWIGKVPTHWDIKKVSWLFTIGSGTTPSTSKKEYYSEEGINWLQTGDLNDGLIVETSKKITQKAVKECGLTIYPVNSLVVAMYGATIGKVGLLEIETTTNQACCVLYNSDMNIKYAYYSFIASKQDLINQAYGGGQPNISQEKIRQQRLSFPPISEQKEIADYLDSRCAEIDRQIKSVTRQIELLREYKQALITEVVTGKRKVC